MGYKVKRIYQGTNLVRPVWTPGPNTLGYWTYDDQNANQITDFSGNGNNCVKDSGNTMPSYVQVVGGNYAGNYNNVSSGGGPGVANLSIDSNKFTVMVWVKIENTGQQYIFNMGNSSGNKPALIYGYNSGQIELYWYDSSTIRSTIKSSTALNTRYCIGYTRNGTTMKTYLNGAYVSSLTVPVSSGLKRILIGGNNNNRLHGQVGECILKSGVEEDLSYMSNYYNQTKANYGL